MFSINFIPASYAQEPEFKFGINIYEHLSYGIIENSGSVPQSTEETYRERETWKPSTSVHLFAEMTTGNKGALGLGIGYQNNGQKEKPVAQRDFFNNYLGDERNIYRHHYLEVPIHYRYKLLKKYYVLGGSSFSVNLNNTVTNEITIGDITDSVTMEDQSTSFNSILIFFNAGLGMNYIRKEKFELYVQQFNQIGVLGHSRRASLSRRILSIGFSTGIRF